MADNSKYRMWLYIGTIALHVSNMAYMATGARHLKQDPILKNFLKHQPRYFTCWNFGLQVIYSVIALFCELLILRNSNNKAYKLNVHLKSLRDTLFAAILWPSTLLVFSVFWSLYLIDRDLIFPEFLDRALTTLSNHVIHTMIVPIVITEAVLRPRSIPKSHKRNIIHLLLHLIAYFCVLVYTYNQAGIWIYPILDKLYGTVYFPISLISILSLCVIYYYLQWVITWVVWGKNPAKIK